MQQNNFRSGDIVKEKHRNIPMKITDVLPAKNNDGNNYLAINKYVCEWIERGRPITRICQETDLENISSAKRKNNTLSF
jgi:hypothetical protein